MINYQERINGAANFDERKQLLENFIEEVDSFLEDTRLDN